MSLREDLRWLIDGADMLLAGGLPSWPKEWTTKEGAKLRDLVVQLWKKYHQEWDRRATAEYREGVAYRNEQGVRAANEILTDRIEKLEALAQDIQTIFMYGATGYTASIEDVYRCWLNHKASLYHK